MSKRIIDRVIDHLFVGTLRCGDAPAHIMWITEAEDRINCGKAVKLAHANPSIEVMPGWVQHGQQTSPRSATGGLNMRFEPSNARFGSQRPDGSLHAHRLNPMLAQRVRLLEVFIECVHGLTVFSEVLYLPMRR